MITFTDASNTTPYFRNVCKKSAGLLRYCSAINIVTLKSSINNLRAEILSNISALSAEFKLCADIMIKEQESELYPLLEDITNAVSKTDTVAINCLNAISLAKNRVESAMRKKISSEDSGITITDYKGEVKKYSGESVFRDAEPIFDMFDTISGLNMEQNSIMTKIKQLQNTAERFTAKHYNVALKFKASIEDLIFKYTELVAISDACGVAAEIGSQYKDNHDALMLLLDDNIEVVINTIKNIYVEKLKA